MSSAEHRDIYVAIIDDEESLRRSMCRFLRASGLWPMTYESAEEFLADEIRTHFDCLVLDIHLGGMSGMELHQKLLADGDTVPVIFITAHDAPEVRVQAESAGCAGYFRKTDPGERVLAAIRAAVQNRPVKIRPGA